MKGKVVAYVMETGEIVKAKNKGEDDFFKVYNGWKLCCLLGNNQGAIKAAMIIMYMLEHGTNRLLDLDRLPLRVEVLAEYLHFSRQSGYTYMRVLKDAGLIKKKGDAWYFNPNYVFKGKHPNKELERMFFEI